MLQGLYQTKQKTHDKIRAIIEHHGKHLPLVAFIWGFIWDNLTLSRVDLLFDNIVIFSYISIAMGSILLINLHESGKLRFALGRRVAPWLPYCMQFAFGGLFSGYVVFYSRSASLATNWLFIAILAALFVGNEFLKKRYQRLTFQLSVFFITLYTFTIFYVPIIVGSIELWVFLLSGVVSLITIFLFMYGLARMLPVRLRESRRSSYASILGIYLVFNLLYFANLIPPLPLGLKDIGMVHSVSRSLDGDYVLEYEPAAWYQFFSRESSEYHYLPGEAAYCWSAVFAPTRLSTRIVHRWQKYSDVEGKWLTEAIIGYRINGGRDGGYRGYTVKQNISAGRWRCDVITERGALIGRVKFEAVPANGTIELEKEVVE